MVTRVVYIYNEGIWQIRSDTDIRSFFCSSKYAFDESKIPWFDYKPESKLINPFCLYMVVSCLRVISAVNTILHEILIIKHRFQYVSKQYFTIKSHSEQTQVEVFIHHTDTFFQFWGIHGLFDLWEFVLIFETFWLWKYSALSVRIADQCTKFHFMDLKKSTGI